MFFGTRRPSRRFLLDLLFERDGRTLMELDAELEMTRFGVMKHLRVLEEAGLVVTRRQGREKLHFLNPVPIRQIHDRWIDKYTERRVSALLDLKTSWRRRHDDDRRQTTVQVYQVFIKATPGAGLGGDHRSRSSRAQYFHGVADRGHAGPALVRRRRTAEDWGDGAVFEWDPPRRLVHEWRSLYDPELAAEEPSRVTWEIEPQDGGSSKLTRRPRPARERRRRPQPASRAQAG